MKLNLYLHLSIIAIFCSCKALVGFKEPRHLSNEEIIAAQKKLNIPEINSFIIDTSFNDAVRFCTNEQRKNHLQPLQISFYNNSGKLIAFYVNCYASGFPLLNWNPSNIMDSFPPKTLAPLDECLSLDKHMSFLKSITSVERSQIKTGDYDLIVVIHWNWFMYKQTNNLIKTYFDSLERNSEVRTLTMFVNNDNYFSL